MEEYTGGIGVAEAAVTASGFVLLIGKLAWDKFFNSETKVNEALLVQVTERLKLQEDKLKKVEDALDLERRLRRLEQNKVHSLVLYIIELKSELRKHGIEVPVHGTLLHEDKELAQLLGLGEGEEENEQMGISPISGQDVL